MALNHMFDLAWEVTGDTLKLEQDCGSGEVHRIDLHRMHVSLLASEMGLLAGDADAWRRVEALERRLGILRQRIERLDAMLRAARPGGGAGESAELIFSEASAVLARELCADLGDGSTVEGRPEPRPVQGDLLEGQQ